MAQKELKDMSLDDLQKAEKSLKFTVRLLIVFWTAWLLASIYLSVYKGKLDTTLFVCLAFSALMPINWSNLKKIRAEIASR